MNTVEIPSVEEQITNMKQKDDQDIDFFDMLRSLPSDAQEDICLMMDVARTVKKRL